MEEEVKDSDDDEEEDEEDEEDEEEDDDDELFAVGVFSFIDGTMPRWTSERETQKKRAKMPEKRVERVLTRGGSRGRSSVCVRGRRDCVNITALSNADVSFCVRICADVPVEGRRLLAMVRREERRRNEEASGGDSL